MLIYKMFYIRDALVSFSYFLLLLSAVCANNLNVHNKISVLLLCAYHSDVGADTYD